MTIYDLKNQIQTHCIPRPLIAVLGNFDGVHIGHQALFRQANALRQEFPTAKCAAWTFAKHPLEDSLLCLNTKEERLQKFTACGMDFAILEDFARVRNFTPEVFVKEILHETLHCCAVVCGFNYKFGCGGCGDVETLKKLGEQYGIQIIAVAPVTESGIVVSSTRIRAALACGDVAQAARCLGQMYTLTAPVVHGREIGHTIGIPTINQEPPLGKQLTGEGVYATLSTLQDGRSYRSVTNVGAQPTVQGKQLCLETHLIHFNGNLYGKTVQISFLQRLRAIQSFPSLEVLQRTIQNDIAVSLSLHDPTITSKIR